MKFYSKHFLLIAFALFCYTSYGQYYYNDLLSIQQSKQQYLLLKTNKIKKVKASNLDADNTVVEGFLLEQEIDNNASTITTTTSTSAGAKSIVTSSYEKDLLQNTIEEATGIFTKIIYNYDEKNRIKTIVSSTFDTSVNNDEISEQHIWKYNAKGQPDIMYKVKNNIDTTSIEFVIDEAGNVVEELWIKGKKLTERYYYYYNDKNMLTDIVRYNVNVKKLLPDFLYEYDATGKLTKMTVVKQGGTSYMVWKYIYNDKGLKEKETCYDKKKQFLGSIQYTYQ